jgi:hypothetical protein
MSYSSGHMQITLAAPATNERGPRYMEKALAAIQQADHERRLVTLSYGVHEGRVGLSVRFQRGMQEHVTGPILVIYPNCSLTVVEKEGSLPVHRSDSSSDKWEAWTAELALVPELFPVLRHSQFEDLLNRNFADPVSGLLRDIKPAEDSECRIEIAVAPATSRRCRRAMRTTLETSTNRLHEREDDLQAASDKVGCHLFETQIRLSTGCGRRRSA